MQDVTPGLWGRTRGSSRTSSLTRAHQPLDKGLLRLGAPDFSLIERLPAQETCQIRHIACMLGWRDVVVDMNMSMCGERATSNLRPTNMSQPLVLMRTGR
jgi:hypothetical protein